MQGMPGRGKRCGAMAKAMAGWAHVATHHGGKGRDSWLGLKVRTEDRDGGNDRLGQVRKRLGRKIGTEGREEGGARWGHTMWRHGKRDGMVGSCSYSPWGLRVRTEDRDEGGQCLP